MNMKNREPSFNGELNLLPVNQINEEYKERYEEFYKRFCCYDDGNASKHIAEEVFK